MSGERTIRLFRESFPGRPAFDTAVSRALMLRVSAGDIPETLRLYRPDAIVAFAKRDTLEPGFRDAVRAARGAGFDAVVRLAGGRAAVFHEQTIALARAVPERDPTSRTFARFEETAETLASAFRALGVDARVGEVPLEYCPGGYSVNAGGRTKLAGIGQRLVARAAHVGGVVVAGGARRVRDVLVPVYSALRLDWNPETVGSVEDECGATWEEVERAIVEEFSRLYQLEESRIDEDTMKTAEKLESEHLV
jgi:lipoate-protein ligase A